MKLNVIKEIPVEELVKKGKMTKSPIDMTTTERLQWAIDCQKDAKDYLFSIGQPVVYKKDGKTIAEFANGAKRRLR